MAEQNGNTVVRRKAEAGKLAPYAAPMTAERAIGQALARVAQDQLELPLHVHALKEARMTLADLPELFQDLSLYALLEGPKEGLGLMVLPPDTLAALIEMQTMGRLSTTPPAPRRPTRIDAAMAADFVDGVLAEIEVQLAEHDAITWAGGFRYGSYLDDPRPIGLMFEDISYRVWTIEMGFGPGGDRAGRLIWAVPATGRGARPRPAAAPEASEITAPASEAGADEAELWHAQMEAVVKGAPAELLAVLQRVQLPLQAVMSFRPGLEIPLSAACLEQVRVEGGGRRLLSFARLGQQNGARALRLRDSEAEPTAVNRGRRRDDTDWSRAGQSPFPAMDPAEVPELGTLSGLGAPEAQAYDLREDLPGNLAMATPMEGLALDGFDPATLDPEALKTGSDG